uniref:Uncharacterized protein n=1 Tax=Setaria viridis TaxID=4556 RepID=A0A4U6UVK0_SETVI|nr:hypothetical protein SEVIR_5G417932v2 [Setaria viridis]
MEEEAAGQDSAGDRRGSCRWGFSYQNHRRGGEKWWEKRKTGRAGLSSWCVGPRPSVHRIPRLLCGRGVGRVAIGFGGGGGVRKARMRRRGSTEGRIKDGRETRLLKSYWKRSNG